jgi:hypothetical protein
MGKSLVKKPRRQAVAERAYYLAEQRRFEPGHELDDWLSAEREVEGVYRSQSSDNPTLCGG